MDEVILSSLVMVGVMKSSLIISMLAGVEAARDLRGAKRASRNGSFSSATESPMIWAVTFLTVCPGSNVTILLTGI